MDAHLRSKKNEINKLNTYFENVEDIFLVESSITIPCPSGSVICIPVASLVNKFAELPPRFQNIPILSPSPGQ